MGRGRGTEKEQASEEASHRAKDDAMRCTQVGVYWFNVYPLIQHVDFRQQLVDYIGVGCSAFTAFPD